MNTSRDRGAPRPSSRLRREAVLAVISPRTGLVREPQTSSMPRLLDSSVAIDGHVIDVEVVPEEALEPDAVVTSTGGPR